MRESATARRRTSPLTWVLVLAGVLSGGAGLVTWHGRAEGPQPLGEIVVVDAPSRSVPDPVPPDNVPASPVAERDRIPPHLAAARVAEACPLLKNVSLRCTDEGCTLSGRLWPMEAQADLDARQEMLLGGLAAVLAAEGYCLVVPFRLDEIDDNVFDLKASVTIANCAQQQPV